MGDVFTSHTTGVEGTHRELGSRLTNRLGGHDSDRFADFDLAPGGQATGRSTVRQTPCSVSHVSTERTRTVSTSSAARSSANSSLRPMTACRLAA